MASTQNWMISPITTKDYSSGSCVSIQGLFLSIILRFVSFKSSIFYFILATTFGKFNYIAVKSQIVIWENSWFGSIRNLPFNGHYKDSYIVIIRFQTFGNFEYKRVIRILDPKTRKYLSIVNSSFKSKAILIESEDCQNFKSGKSLCI